MGIPKNVPKFMIRHLPDVTTSIARSLNTTAVDYSSRLLNTATGSDSSTSI